MPHPTPHQGAEPDFEGATMRERVHGEIAVDHESATIDADFWKDCTNTIVEMKVTSWGVGNLARAYLALSAEAGLAGKLREALRAVQIKRGRPGRHCRQCGGRWIAQAEMHAPDCLAAPATEGRKG